MTSIELNRLQPWAITGGITGLANILPGFWCYCDVQHLDAPSWVPTGSTIPVTYENERNAIGGIVLRDGAYQ